MGAGSSRRLLLKEMQGRKPKPTINAQQTPIRVAASARPFDAAVGAPFATAARGNDYLHYAPAPASTFRLTNRLPSRHCHHPHPTMSITYLEAIREAQARALAEDDRVFIYGQDVGAFGGAFKATKGLAKLFPGRVIDSPISEDAAVGLAVGAAAEGMRPIIEMQFADFSSVAFSQIVNQAATMFWRTDVPCPIVIRLPSGGTAGSGPFHSQSMEAIYAHYPGLIVMTPATVEDAYGMLLEAIQIDDPVIFCEHKFLYYHLKAERLPTEPTLPIGKARIARRGRDATVVTYSAMVHEALAAAETLAEKGIEIEVLDLRTVKPLGHRRHSRERRPHRPATVRRRSGAVGRRHRRSCGARLRRGLHPARCPAPPSQRQRHAGSIPSGTLDRSPAQRAGHRGGIARLASVLSKAECR